MRNEWGRNTCGNRLEYGLTDPYCTEEYDILDYIYGMVDFTVCNRHTCIIPKIQEHPVYLCSVYYVDNVYI